jgi:hypothetical protein
MNLFTAFLAGTFIAAPAWASDSYTIEAAQQPAQSWYFQRLMASQNDDGLPIHGRLTASQQFDLPRGHIDIAAYSPNGDLLAETTTSYTPSLLTYRVKRQGGVHFSAGLTAKLPPGSVIKVAFHRDDPHPSLSPPHTGTIAR